mgnify:CR=1 FL=1
MRLRWVGVMGAVAALLCTVLPLRAAAEAAAAPAVDHEAVLGEGPLGEGEVMPEGAVRDRHDKSAEPSLEGPPPRGSRVFVRAQLGIVGAGSSMQGVGGAASHGISGGGGYWQFALGRYLRQDLALHGALMGWSLSNPRVFVDGTEFPYQDVEMRQTAFLVGITRWASQLTYLSASLGLGWLHMILGPVDLEGRTGVGLVVDGTLGHEWPLTTRVGLGGALGLGFHVLPDGDDLWTGLHFTMHLTLSLR